MKKVYTLLWAFIAMTLGIHAQEKGALMLLGPEVSIVYYVTNASTNGEWMCGYSYDGAAMHAFLWNTRTNNFSFITSAEIDCAAMDVSNDGIVVADYDGKAAYYKNGVWNFLPGGEGGGAWCISSNGKHIGGIAHYNGKYRPCSWTNEEITIYGDANAVGAIYDISDDGNIVVGYNTYYNRTPTLWINGEEVTINLSDLGPFSVAEGLSPNAKKVIANRQIYDIETKQSETIDFGYIWSYHLYNITNEGVPYGEIQLDMGTPNIAALYIDGQFVSLQDSLSKLGVDFKGLNVYQCIGISEDHKRFALTCYDTKSYCIRPMFIELDANITSREPVSLKIQQFEGLKNCKLTWEAPIVGSEGVVSYNIYRNNQLLANVSGTNLSYYDREVNYETYTYTVSAVYKNGIESVQSDPVTATIKARSAAAPREVNVAQSRINDVRLYWEAPLSNLPSLNYIPTGDTEVVGFGGGAFSFEAAIRFRKEDLAFYSDKKISHIYFYPMSRQNSWTINFYKASDVNNPIYSQVIDNDILQYRVINTIALNDPIAIPTDEDLIMGIYVDVTNYGGYDVIGCMFNSMDKGYTDLLRQWGTTNLTSIYDMAINSESGAYEYIVTWPMGINLRGDNDVASETLNTYKIFANDKEIAQTSTNKFLIENVADGAYTYGVQAVYNDGSASDIISTHIDLKADMSRYKSIEEVLIQTDGTKVKANWEAPMDDDAANITYSSNNNTGGIAATSAEGYGYQVAAKFGLDKTRPYNQDYNITGFRFYPLANAEFTFYLYTDDSDEEIAYKELIRGEDYNLYTWNTITLDEPITLDANKKYTLVLDCYDVDPDMAPVGMDDQKATPNASDLYSIDDGETWYSLYERGGKNANWMIGLVVKSKDVRKLNPEVEGYNIIIDQKQQNETPIKETTFTTDLTEGVHNLRIDVVYGSPVGTKKGTQKTFTITAVALEQLEAEDRTLVITPEQGSITVEGGVKQLSVYNTQGHCLATTESNTLSTEHLNAGIYLLQIKSESGKTTLVKMQIK